MFQVSSGLWVSDMQFSGCPLEEREIFNLEDVD